MSFRVIDNKTIKNLSSLNINTKSINADYINGVKVCSTGTDTNTNYTATVQVLDDGRVKVKAANLPSGIYGLYYIILLINPYHYLLLLGIRIRIRNPNQQVLLLVWVSANLFRLGHVEKHHLGRLPWEKGSNEYNCVGWYISNKWDCFWLDRFSHGWPMELL